MFIWWANVNENEIQMALWTTQYYTKNVVKIEDWMKKQSFLTFLTQLVSENIVEVKKVLVKIKCKIYYWKLTWIWLINCLKIYWEINFALDLRYSWWCWFSQGNKGGCTVYQQLSINRMIFFKAIWIWKSKAGKN